MSNKKVILPLSLFIFHYYNPAVDSVAFASEIKIEEKDNKYNIILMVGGETVLERKLGLGESYEKITLDEDVLPKSANMFLTRALLKKLKNKDKKR